MTHRGKGRWGRHTRSSHTAAKIARGVVYLARDPLHAGLFPEGAAESVERLALAAGAVTPRMCRFFERRWVRGLLQRVVEKLGPGEFMRLTLRKRFVDDETRAAIADGATQLLIVGPGFDTVGLRMAEAFPHVTVVEVDMPATAERRRHAIEQLGTTYQNHHLLGVDVSSVPLGDVLAGISSWDSKARSVVVAEGVLMYLGESEVTSFLAELKEHTGLESRLVFTYLRGDERGKPSLGKLGFIKASLKLAGEPLHWAVGKEELEPFFQRAGCRLLGPPERFDLHRRYLEPAGLGDQPVGKMEQVAVAAI